MDGDEPAVDEGLDGVFKCEYPGVWDEAGPELCGGAEVAVVGAFYEEFPGGGHIGGFVEGWRGRGEGGVIYGWRADMVGLRVSFGGWVWLFFVFWCFGGLSVLLASTVVASWIITH